MAEVKKITPEERRNNIIQIGIWYVEQFEKDNYGFIESLIRLPTVRQVMIMVYQSLVIEKKISPIEKWELPLKESLWLDAKEFSMGRLDNKGCIQLSKCLYVLKLL